MEDAPCAETNINQFSDFYFDSAHGASSIKMDSKLQKMSVRSIPIYPANLVTFEESLIFGHPNAPFGRPWRLDAK